MWIRDPGKIVDSLDFLGTRENCVYLLRGEEAMLIGGGTSWIVPSLEAQFSAIDLEPDRLKYLVISHSHFDHCGAVPYLKRKFPHMRIIASAHAAKVLCKEKVVNSIASSNKEIIDRLGLQDEYERLNLKFDGIQVDRIVVEKDIIDLGNGIEAHFMEVPGHSECCISVYVPKLKALFPSDAAPPPIGDKNQIFQPSFQYDFSLYRESLEKMANCETEICAWEHYGVVVGDEVKKILDEGLRQTEEFKNYIIDLYQQIGDLDKMAQKVAAEISQKGKLDFVSSETWVAASKAEIRSVLRYVGILGESTSGLTIDKRLES